MRRGLSNDRQLPAGAVTAVPWWFERTIGLLLALLVGAVLWAVSWNITGQVQAQPSTVTPEWESTETVAASSGPDPSRMTAARTSAGTGKTSDGVDDESGGEPGDEAGGEAGDDLEIGSSGEQRPDPTDRALQAEVLRERHQERVQRAQRADRDLAAFIQSIGVVGPLTAWVAPISGEYRVTATFGQSGSLWSRDHTGVDLAATSGTPVVSVAAGTVTSAGDAGAYGMRVEVMHLDGTQTSYSHMSRIDVVEGQTVEGGTPLGAVGSTGNSTGPHLHLELEPAGGIAVDPVEALLARGVVIG